MGRTNAHFSWTSQSPQVSFVSRSILCPQGALIIKCFWKSTKIPIAFSNLAAKYLIVFVFWIFFNFLNPLWALHFMHWKKMIPYVKWVHQGGIYLWFNQSLFILNFYIFLEGVSDLSVPPGSETLKDFKKKYILRNEH